MPRLLPFIALGAAFAAVASFGAASAQLPAPPSTITGSITDADGEVPAGLKIEAYVGNKLCGESETVYTGDGDARVTVYVVDVVSDDQTAGCGTSGDAVRIKVGDRLSPKAAVWEAGLVRFDIIFGENVTPKPIPTFTPTPPVTPTADASVSGGSIDSTGTPTATLRPGETRTATATLTARSTGTTSSTPGAPGAGDSGDGGGGFPLWGTILLAVLGLGLAGGGIGIFLARRTTNEPAAQ